jgi:predicted secreted protein
MHSRRSVSSLSRRLRHAPRSVCALAFCAVCIAQMPWAGAQGVAAHNCCVQPSGVLQLEAMAQAEVTPDRAVAAFAAVRSGPDVAALNAEVAKLLDSAVKAARATPGMQVQTGSFQTQPRYKVVAGQSQQDGWTVRAQLIVKSADFAAVGRLAGQLAQSLQVESTGSEISTELQARELAKLTQMAIAKYRTQAQAAAHDFGYSGYVLRDVNIGGLQGAAPAPRPMFRAMAAAPMGEQAVPIEAGVQTLGVSVSGSVQLQR